MNRPIESSTATLRQLEKAGLRAPKTLTFSITGACNLDCVHCWVEAGAAQTLGHVPDSQLHRVIREFFRLGGQGLRLTGGEPLCHPGCLDALRLARRLGFEQLFLQTNGMMFGREQVAGLQEVDFSGLSIQVSLDGATAASHDRVRGEGAFLAVMDGLRRLVLADLVSRVTLFFTEMRHNLQELPEVLELAAGLNIGSVVSGSLVRCGRAGTDAAVAPADPEQYLALIERYRSDPGFRSLYHRIGNIAALEWYRSPDASSECCTFVETPYLTADGKLFPCILCHADDYAVSEVFAKPLDRALSEGAPLWSALLAISRQRKSALAQCGNCPEKPICAGGCLGRAWGSFRNLLAVEDRCEVRQLVGRHRRDSAGKK